MTEYREEFEIVRKCKFKRTLHTIMDVGFILVLYSLVALLITFVCNPYLFVK